MCSCSIPAAAAYARALPQMRHLLVEPLIAQLNARAHEVVSRNCLLQREHMMGSPTAFQRLFNQFLLRPRTCHQEARKDLGISLPGNDRTDDRHPRGTRNICENFVDLDVHLLQCLMHQKNLLRALTYQTLALTPVRAKHHDLSIWDNASL